MARLPRGRKRIPIQKIEAQSNLEVTFSKRRNGVFRKASELSLLCDCHVAIVIFSEDNIYGFGEPSFEQIMDTFMNQIPDQQNSVVEHLMKDHKNPECAPSEEEMVEYKVAIEVEKTWEDTISELPNHLSKENCLKKWWLTPVEDLTLDEAEKMLEELEKFQHSIDSHATHEETSSSRQTNEVSPVVPHAGGFPLTPHPYLTFTSNGLEQSDKGKAPMQD